MNHQITLEELGMIPKQTHIERSIYATPCGGCVCNHCANNVDCMDVAIGEAKFACFNCDDCFNFSGYGRDNWKPECKRYKVTDKYAKATRKRFKLLQGKEMQEK